jgi:CubicO group peptidase (beta-lactamase class C family)
VIRNDKIVGEWYWGRRSPSPEAPPYNANTMTPLMSITKGLTATALALLIQDGTMWLDEKVSEYIPEFKEGDLAKITVRHLATHSSGLPGSDVALAAAGATSVRAKPCRKLTSAMPCTGRCAGWCMSPAPGTFIPTSR